MRSVLGLVADFFLSPSPEDKRLMGAIRQITGDRPRNVHLYRLALQHTSAAREITTDGFRESNERLEYLGDAILGSIVAEFLFKKFPFKDEGFLTEIRSRIVNRESLNGLARKIGLNQLIVFDGNRRTPLTHKSMHGDALEALVGATYLDRGFDFTRQFVIERLLTPHFDLENIVQHNQNFKSMLIEWAQRTNAKLDFTILEERGSIHNREFVAQVSINGEAIATGTGFSKKKAEQAAAEKSCGLLDVTK